MELMKKIVTAACFLSIAISLADSVKPGERFTRQLKLIFSLVFITGIAAAALNSGFEYEIPVYAGTEGIEKYPEISEAADNAVISETEKALVQTAEGILVEKGVGFEKITADINIDPEGCININGICYCGNEFEKASAVLRESMGEIEVRRAEQ